MDSLVPALIFIFPGFFIEILYRRFIPKSADNDVSEYNKITKAFLFSLAVVILNLVIIKYFFSININSLTQLQERILGLTFLIKYTMLTVLSSVVIAYLWSCHVVSIIRRLFNWYRGKKNLPEETKYPAVWDEIFENPKIDLKNRVVMIEKDGNLISCGFLESFSPANKENKDIALTYSNYIKEYIEKDKELAPGEKILEIVAYEYYDFSTGNLIKIYDSEKLCIEWEKRFATS